MDVLFKQLVTFRLAPKSYNASRGLLIFYFAISCVLLFADIGQSKTKDGFFLSVGPTLVSVGGDFDGKSFVGGGGAVAVLPDLDTAYGYKVALGWQSFPGSVDFNYENSKHDSDWMGVKLNSKLETYNFDVKIFLFNEFYRIQPLIAIGYGYNKLTVKDGSTGGERTADSEFHGWDIHFGCGAQIYLSNHFAVDLVGVYRYGSYNRVNGLVDGYIEDYLDGNGFTSSAELKFIF